MEVARTSPIFFQRGSIPTSEALAGIGCHLDLVGSEIIVSGLKAGSSAEAGGLQVGSVLLAVDGISLAGRDLAFARSLIKGQEGTSVSLLLRSSDHRNFGDVYVLLLRRIAKGSDAPDVVCNILALNFSMCRTGDMTNGSNGSEGYFAKMPQDLQERDRKIVGVGCTVQAHGLEIIVTGVSKGGGADVGGLAVGSVIISVDGTELYGQGIEFAKGRILGPAGSEVSVAVRAPGGRESLLTLKRGHVSSVPVVSETRTARPKLELKLTPATSEGAQTPRRHLGSSREAWQIGSPASVGNAQAIHGPEYHAVSTNSLVGIGCGLEMQSGRVLVFKVKEDSSAARVGLSVGCTVLEVNGVPVLGHDLPSVREMIMGPEGSTVNVSVRFPGADSITALNIPRGHLSSTGDKLLSGGEAVKDQTHTIRTAIRTADNPDEESAQNTVQAEITKPAKANFDCDDTSKQYLIETPLLADESVTDNIPVIIQMTHENVVVDAIKSPEVDLERAQDVSDNSCVQAKKTDGKVLAVTGHEYPLFEEQTSNANEEQLEILNDKTEVESPLIMEKTANCVDCFGNQPKLLNDVLTTDESLESNMERNKEQGDGQQQITSASTSDGGYGDGREEEGREEKVAAASTPIDRCGVEREHHVAPARTSDDGCSVCRDEEGLAQSVAAASTPDDVSEEGKSEEGGGQKILAGGTFDDVCEDVGTIASAASIEDSSSTEKAKISLENVQDEQELPEVLLSVESMLRVDVNSQVGIGCNLDLRGSDIIVSKLKAGGSAERGGLIVGSVVRAVDGINIGGYGLQDVRSMIMGVEGTEVLLTVCKPDTSESMVMTLVRKPNKFSVTRRDSAVCWAKGNGFTGVHLEDFNHILEIVNKGSLQISSNKIELGERIGKGSFGSIYAASLGDELVAIKRVCEVGTNGRNFKKSVRSVLLELLAAAELCVGGHPNIVAFKGMSARFPERKEDDFELSFVFELCENGSLSQNLFQKKVQFSFEDKIKISQQISLGLQHIHDLGFVHRDLNSQNILLTRDNDARICDFGCARKVVGKEYQSSTISGNPAYMSPEQLEGKTLSTKTDIWALGILLWEIMMVQRPWTEFCDPRDMNSLRRVIVKEGRRLPEPSEGLFPAGVHQAFNIVVKYSLQSAPLARPTVHELVETLTIIRERDFSEEKISQHVKQRGIENLERLKGLLNRFYDKYNPSKKATVDDLANRFSEKQEELFKLLRKAYSADPGDLSTSNPKTKDTDRRIGHYATPVLNFSTEGVELPAQVAGLS